MARAIRRIERKVMPWAGPDAGRIRSMRGFRAGLAKAVDACSLLTVQEWTRAATHPWPVSMLRPRPVDRVACMLLELAVFFHHYNERSRRYVVGSYGNDIIDRARVWVGGGKDFEEVRDFLRRVVASKDGVG
jgi:hypothetical protein